MTAGRGSCPWAHGDAVHGSGLHVPGGCLGRGDGGEGEEGSGSTTSAWKEEEEQRNLGKHDAEDCMEESCCNNSVCQMVSSHTRLNVGCMHHQPVRCTGYGTPCSIVANLGSCVDKQGARETGRCCTAELSLARWHVAITAAYCAASLSHIRLMHCRRAGPTCISQGDRHRWLAILHC